MKKWTVITVTYNSRSDLEMYWQEQAARDHFHWIVVDNGSCDGTQGVANELADVVLHAGSNIGFSRANNLGLAAAPEDGYIAFVNPDVRIEGRSWPRLLANSIDTYDALVAPQLANADGTLQPNARGLPYLQDKLRNRIGRHDHRESRYARYGFSVPTYCAWAMGAALSGRAATFHHLGGWNDRFFLYYEDHEIGLRAWSRGVPVVIDPSVQWTHRWDRATRRFNRKAWLAEIASAKEFFTRYPALVVGPNARSSTHLRRQSLDSLEDLLWQPAQPNNEPERLRI